MWRVLPERVCIGWLFSIESVFHSEYSDPLYYFCLILSSYPRTGYDFLRRRIECLTCFRAVHDNFEKDITGYRLAFTDIQRLRAFLDCLLRVNSSYLGGTCLAIDAICCTNSVIGMQLTKKINAVYLFWIQLQPLHPDAEYIPLFAISLSSGNASSENQTKFSEVIEIVNNAGVLCRMIASDDDQGYNNRYTKFFTYWTVLF
jgi:hypothetical protein